MAYHPANKCFILYLFFLQLVLVFGNLAHLNDVKNDANLTSTLTTEGAPTTSNKDALLPYSGDPSSSWMLPNTASRLYVWVIGFTSLIGNAFVLIWRCAGKGSENPVQVRLIANLAVSDLLMGVFLLIIASFDMYFNQGFASEASWWKTGTVCKLANILSVLATEASVLFITLISIDRVMAVAFKYPLCARLRPSKTAITIISSMLWLFATILGIIPTLLLPTPELQSDICISLPLIKTPFLHISSNVYIPPLNQTDTTSINSTTNVHSKTMQSEMGTYFLISLYLGLNMCCLLIVAVCYLTIFCLVYQSTRKLGMTRPKNELRMCIRMGLIVATDFITWLPVVIIGILVQMDLIYITHDVYIIIVIFILPINSAFNPYLYTFSAILYDYIDHRKYKVAKRRETNPSVV